MSTIKTQNHIRLREDEGIRIDDNELEYRVLRKMADLDMRWGTGAAAFEISALYYNQYPNKYHLVLTCNHMARTVAHPPKHSITATEWLNRHGILVPGQEVLVADEEHDPDWSRRILIAERVTFAMPGPGTARWNFVKSPHEPWKDIPEEPEIKLTVNGKEIKISAETLAAIKEAL
jgi:hypothetical protein